MRRILNDNPNTRDHWNVIYSAATGIAPEQQLRYRMIANNIIDLPLDVVDLGCGTGMCDAVLLESRPSLLITGVDISDCPPTLPFLNKYVQGEVTKTGLSSESFDYAISCEVLEHLEDPQKLVDEMFRLLRVGGKALLTTPLLNKLPSNEHVWEFSIPDVQEMFEKAGFRNVYAFPWASNGRVADQDGKIVQFSGTWDQIYVFAEKL